MRLLSLGRGKGGTNNENTRFVRVMAKEKVKKVIRPNWASDMGLAQPTTKVPNSPIKARLRIPTVE